MFFVVNGPYYPSQSIVRLSFCWLSGWFIEWYILPPSFSWVYLDASARNGCLRQRLVLSPFESRLSIPSTCMRPIRFSRLRPMLVSDESFIREATTKHTSLITCSVVMGESRFSFKRASVSSSSRKSSFVPTRMKGTPGA